MPNIMIELYSNVEEFYKYDKRKEENYKHDNERERGNLPH